MVSFLWSLVASRLNIPVLMDPAYSVNNICNPGMEQDWLVNLKLADCDQRRLEPVT